MWRVVLAESRKLARVEVVSKSLVHTEHFKCYAGEVPPVVSWMGEVASGGIWMPRFWHFSKEQVRSVHCGVRMEMKPAIQERFHGEDLSSEDPQAMAGRGVECGKGSSAVSVVECGRKQQSLDMEVESTCRILARGLWGPDKEVALAGLGLGFHPSYDWKVLKNLANVDMACGFFKWVGTQRGGAHSVHACNILVAMLGNARRFNEAEEVLVEVKRSRVRMPPRIFIELARSYASAGLLEKSVEALKRMEAHGCALTVSAYNSLIDAFVKAGYRQKALAVYKVMGQSGLRPDTYTFNVLMNAFKKGEKIDSVCKLFREMQNQDVSPDVVTYSTLIDALCKGGEVEEAVHVFADMKARGYKPNVFTYTSMIDGLGKSGQVDKAFFLFEEMTSEGLVASRVVYNALIHGLGRSGRADAAGKLFREMISKGLQPDYVTFTSLVYGLGVAGRASEARRMFHEAREHGCALDASLYNVLIDALCKAKRLDEAWEIFGELEGELLNRLLL
jgi:pentatricopeptide repeat protein